MFDMNTNKWISDLAYVAIAGAAGGLIRTMSDPLKNWKKLAIDIPTGAILAIYLGDFGTAMLSPITGIVKLSPESQAKAGAFIVGVLGMLIIEAIVIFWKARIESLKNGKDK